jgi:hypothetical protein
MHIVQFQILLANKESCATVDPVIVNFKGVKYFLFSNNQWVIELKTCSIEPCFQKASKPDAKVYDELCAPAAFVMKDEMYLIGSTHGPNFILYKTKDGTIDWEVAVEKKIPHKVGAWDPGFL